MQSRAQTLPLDDWQRLKIQILWCYEGQPPFVDGVTRYRTPNYSAWLVLRGDASLHHGEQARTLPVGHWVIVPPPGHRRHFTETVELLSVHFRFSWPDDTDLFTLAEPVAFPAARHPGLERAARRLRQFFHRFGPRGKLEPLTHALTLTQHLHFQTLGGHFARALTDALDAEKLLPHAGAARGNPRFGSMLAELRGLPLDRLWDSAATARAVGMSTGHFNRVFRQEFGQTPRRYFDTRRLEHAKQGVIAGKVSIKEIAAGLGFSSAVFCRWFKQAVGASPTRYRRNVGLSRTR